MKKTLVIVLCAIMMFALAACSNASPAETSTGDTSDANAASQQETAQDTPAPADSAETGTDELVEDPDTYEGAVFYTDLANQLGAIPKPAAGTQIGFAAKAFENEYWSALKDGVEAQGEELQGSGLDITFDVRAAQGEADEQGQAAVMNDMINREYDAIIASPISDGNLVQATEKAQAAGIPVVDAIGGFVPIMDIFVGPQHYMSGELAAQWLYEKIGDEECSVAVIMGMPKESAARARTQGFLDWMAANATNIKVVDPQNADWDRTKAKDVMDTLIKANADLKGVYLNNDTMAMGALESVKAANKLGEIFVVGNDGTNEALTSIKNGELDATVNIYPYFAGKICVDIALRAMAGQDLPKVIYQNQAIVDATNVDQPAEDVFGWEPLTFAE